MMYGPCLADNFFDGPTASPGDPMFLSIYSIEPLQKGQLNLSKIANGGFTSGGPHYGAGNGGDPIGNPTEFYTRVAESRGEGLGMVAHITWHPDVINDPNGFVRDNSMSAISESDLRAHVREVMDYTLNDPNANATVTTWYTLPEELRPWRTAEMNYLNIVVDEVKSYDPQGRPVSMYNPNNRSSSQLETIVNQGLDWTMMGVYATNVSFSTRGARIADGVDRIIAAADNTSTLPVTVFQLSEDYNSTDILNLRNALGGATQAQAVEHVIRHDVYQSLLRGSKAIQIWSGCDCRAGLSTFSQQLDGYISVSQDLNLGLNLSDVFLQGESRSDFEATVLTGPTTVTHGSYTVDTITLSDIAYGDDRYLFLANSSNSLLSISVDGLPSGVPQISDLFNNAPELSVDAGTGEMLLNMQPLEVIALKIESVWNADANANGVVDGSDFLALQAGFGTSGATTVADGDFNYDGMVDGLDLIVWESQYGSIISQVSLATAVPEPSSWLVMLSGFSVLLSNRKRQGI